MKRLFFAVVCLGCVADSFAMNNVRRFCGCVGEKVAPLVPQSKWGKIVEVGLFVGTVYGLYQVSVLKKQVDTTDRTLREMNFPNDWQAQVRESRVQILGLSQTLAEERSKNENLNRTIDNLNQINADQEQIINDLNQTVDSLRNGGEHTIVDLDDNDNDDKVYMKSRDIHLPQPASPMKLDDNGSSNFSLDLNSSLSVSSFVIPEGEEVINLKFDGFEYKGQGHEQEPLGKGEVISAVSSFRMEGFFQDQQLVIDHERPVCFKISGTRFNFTPSEQCQPIVFELNDFEQIKLLYVRNHSNYLLLLTNKTDDNFIFRPAYFYKGQVNMGSHLPEGNGLMVMTGNGSILRGIFKREGLVQAIGEESQQQEPLVQEE